MRIVRKRFIRRKRVFKRKFGKFAAKSKANQITKVVKRVISRQAETKILQLGANIDCRTIQSGTNQTQFEATTVCLTPQGATISGFNMGYPILANGIGQDQRIGDAVKIKGMYVNYLLTAKPYDATFNPTPKPVIVQVWVIKPKTGNVFGQGVAQIQSGPSAIFYENQFNGDSGMGGTLIDTIRKVDRDNFQILYCRTHKIGYSGNLNTTNQVTSFQNNDYQQFARGRIKIKGFNWKVSRNELPQGQNIYMFCQVLNADNTLAGLSALPVLMSFNETIYYTDM